MKKIISAIIFALIVIALAVSFSGGNFGNQNVEMVADESIVENDIKSNQAVGIYTKYDSNLKQYEGKNIVLFFKAGWCPSCRILDTDVKDSLNDIPANVVLLELNYDTETELKKKYGVTVQHTLVQVDVDGNLIKKWSGGSRLEDALNQIK